MIFKTLRVHYLRIYLQQHSNVWFSSPRGQHVSPIARSTRGVPNSTLMATGMTPSYGTKPPPPESKTPPQK